METKEYLISVIKQWVKLENEIKTLKKEQAQRQIEKKKSIRKFDRYYEEKRY